MSAPNLKTKALYLLGAMAICAHAQAATQGSLSSTASVGSANISVTKAVQAQITDIQDMTLSNWTAGDGAVTLYTNVCVYSSTGSYKVTATGSGLAGIFTISSGALTPIAYSVTWNGAGMGNLNNTGTTLVTGLQSSAFSNANSISVNCSNGGANDTARVVVGITSAAMALATASSTPYTGTLTLSIAPN